LVWLRDMHAHTPAGALDGQAVGVHTSYSGNNELSHHIL
jgi:hypothetical protein